MNDDLRAAAVTWWQDDPRRLDMERAAMYAAAPGLLWSWEGSGYWTGEVPLWPFKRPQPAGWTRLVDNKPMSVEIICRQAHPMIDPIIRPLDVDLPVTALGSTDWHLLPSGALCLFRDRSSWDPAALAVDLIEKVSSWHIEYHLMRAGLIRRMTEYGIANDTSLDWILRIIGGLRKC
jgi:hypothetical protein